MTTRNLLEAATLIESPDSGTWKVRLISEGKGSSGIYSAALLENYGRAFNGPTLSFENHPIGWDGPEARNFTQIVGQVVGETWVDTDERGKIGVYANWDPDPDHRERLARYKKNLGLSIYIEGDGHIDEDGEFVVDSFNENDPYKSVDVVIAAGRGGRFEESLSKIYSQRRENEKPSGDNAPQERKDNKMDEKDIAAIGSVVAKAVADAVAPLVSANTAKVEQESQAKVNEEAVKEALKDIQANVDAVEAERENLSTKQVESLRAKAFAGEDITEALAEAKETREAILAEAHEEDESGSTGRFLESGKPGNFTVGGWK